MERLSDNAIEIVNELHTERLDYENEYVPIIEALNRLAEYEEAEEQGLLVRLPCKVGDTVYRICPKCNDKHEGNCEHCAWETSASNRGCTVYGLWGDGQFPPDECTIVPYKVFWNYVPNLLEKFGKTVFLTREEAEKALEEA